MTAERSCGPVVDVRRRRLTARGWGVLVAALVLGAGGQLLGYPMLRVLGGAGLAAVAAGLATLLRSPQASVHRTLFPDRVECGRPALARLVVRNDSGRRQPSFVASDEVTPGSPAAVDLAHAHDAQVAVASLAPGGVATYHYELPTSRRGRLRVGPLTMRRTDALGLASSQVTIGETATLLVRPRRYTARPATGTRQRHHYEGVTSAGPLRGSVDLRRLREYVPGDEVRHVHWKASARTGQLMVREYADPAQPWLRLVLDTWPSALDPDEFEEAVSVAASILTASAEAGHRLRFTTTCGTDHDVESVGDLLDELADVRQVPGGGESAWDDITCLDGIALLDGIAFLDGVDPGRRPTSGLVVLSGGQRAGELAKLAESGAGRRQAVCFDLAAESPAIRILGGTSGRSQGIRLQAATAQAALEAWNALPTGGVA